MEEIMIKICNGEVTVQQYDDVIDNEWFILFGKKYESDESITLEQAKSFLREKGLENVEVYEVNTKSYKISL